MSSWSYPHVLRRLPAPSTLTFRQACSVTPISISSRSFRGSHKTRPSGLQRTVSMSRKRRSINSRESKRMWLPGSAAAGSPSASPARLMSRATPVRPGQWRDKGSLTFLPKEHAAYLPGPGFKATKKDLTPRARSRYDDPLSSIGCHTSMAARAPARPRERSSSSAREDSSSL